MKEEPDETESVPLREEHSNPQWEKMEEQIKDEILFRKTPEPMGKRPRSADILRFM